MYVFYILITYVLKLMMILVELDFKIVENVFKKEIKYICLD